ncbi:hypothetical protein K437DRAFT_294999 [Tilletiaria anomala UBC 951]|uniref:Uncharacterized protein n=1 Tax=Tilletiaria anomala (strain ATCC 24038 / CBS 436.72 / UBC 951) TaxID=1037660 RepID=A0A066VZL2_TILAU|nr:uncharacterized protein K437DRAFT_294999 [Tilletiaria anomala UBC 951]KDN43970.1 hypothetical protein K437DRAFT_294999 [Tilletiaria anomala UBC 951]
MPSTVLLDKGQNAQQVSAEPEEIAEKVRMNLKASVLPVALLYYPSQTLAAQSNSKPFARSAAKRDSVQALGSIGHLQHLYSKRGLVGKHPPIHARRQAVPAIGLSLPEEHKNINGQRAAALRRLSSRSGLSSDDERYSLDASGALDEEEEGPKPSGYRLPPYPHVDKPVEADYEALRPTAVQALQTLSDIWSPYSSGMVLAAGLLRTTRASVRSVRAYLVALPPDVFLAPTPFDTNAEEGGGSSATHNAQLSARLLLARDPVRGKDQYRRRHHGGQGLGHDRDSASSKAANALAGQATPATVLPSASGSGFLCMSLPSLPSSKRMGSISSTSTASGGDAGDSLGMKRSVSASSAVPASASSRTSAAAVANAAVAAPKLVPQIVEEEQLAAAAPALRTLGLLRKVTVDVLGMLEDLRDGLLLSKTCINAPQSGALAGGATDCKEVPTLSISGAVASTDAEDEIATGSGGGVGRNDFGRDDSVELPATPTSTFSASQPELLPTSVSVLHTRSTAFCDTSSLSLASSDADGSVSDGEDVSGKKQRLQHAHAHVNGADKDSQLEMQLAGVVLSVQGLQSQRAIVEHWCTLAAHAIRLTDETLDHWRFKKSSKDGPGQAAGEAAAARARSASDGVHSNGETTESFTSNTVKGAPQSSAAIVRAVADYLPSTHSTALLRALGPASDSDSPANSDEALAILSDGYLLCLAFNAVLRASSSPWGLIQARDIHDTQSEPARVENQAADSGCNATAQGHRKASWTFRKTDNLACWATSLRRRYNVNLGQQPHHYHQMMASVGSKMTPAERRGVSEASPLTSALTYAAATAAAKKKADAAKQSASAEGSGFNAALVAKRESGWKEALLVAVTAWLDAVAAEQQQEMASTHA